MGMPQWVIAETGTIINPIAWMRKLRLREVKRLTQGHTAGRGAHQQCQQLSEKLYDLGRHIYRSGWVLPS